MGSLHHETNKDSSPGGSNSKSKHTQGRSTIQLWFWIFFQLSLLAWMVLGTIKLTKNKSLGAATLSQKIDKEQAQYSYYLNYFICHCLYEWCIAPCHKQGLKHWGQQQQVKKLTRKKPNTAMIVNFFSLRCLHEWVLCTMKQTSTPALETATASQKIDKEQAQYSYDFDFFSLHCWHEWVLCTMKLTRTPALRAATASQK